MHKFRALLIKDWHIHKKTVLFPIWIILAIYALLLIATTVAHFRGELQIHDLTLESDVPNHAVNYIAGMGITYLPGFLLVIFTIMITQSSLNEDIKKNYELFHRSQPVSIWSRTISKFLLGTVANWVVLLAIIIVNFVLLTAVLLSIRQFVFVPAISGALQGFVSHIKISLVLGALCFFFSSVFKDKAFFKGVAFLLSLQFLSYILNILFGWHLPLPLKFFIDMIGSSNFESINPLMSSAEIADQIKSSWQTILFNMKTLYQLLFSACLFAAATLIYQNKEIKID